jgi:hypothetical protein
MKMLYAKDDFAQERLSWKAIIQLNLIRHVLTILKILEEDAAGSSPTSTPSLVLPDPDHPDLSNGAPSNSSAHRHSNLNRIANAPAKASSSQTAFHYTLRLRLAPLTEIESNLSKQLTQSVWALDASKEPMVHSYTAWMKHFGYKSSSPGPSSQAASPASTVGWHFEDEAERVINLCKDDIAALWNDTLVQNLLRERNVRLELEGGFFLDDLDRVCALYYEPTDCKFLVSHVFCQSLILVWCSFLLSGCMQSEAQDIGRHGDEFSCKTRRECYGRLEGIRRRWVKDVAVRLGALL